MKKITLLLALISSISVFAQLKLDQISTPTLTFNECETYIKTIVEGTISNDDIVVKYQDDNLIVNLNCEEVLKQKISETTELIINGGDGDDSLEINFDEDTFSFPIIFNGQGQKTTAGDFLNINGYFTNQEITHIPPGQDGNNGFIALDQSLITFTGLEPINAGNAINTTINLPDGVNNNASLQNSAIAGEIEIIDNGATFENTVIPNPTGSLTINGGNMTDVIFVKSMDASFNADLIVNAGANDLVRFDTNPTSIGTGSYDINAQIIEVAQNVSTTMDGNITFNATQNIFAGSGALISAENGDINFGANSAGILTGVNTDAIALNNSEVRTTGSGNINLNGVGVSTGGTDSNYGIALTNGQVINTGSGAITIIGVGGNGVNNNQGINITTNAIVRSNGGGISLDGTAGNVTGTLNQGVTVVDQSIIEDLTTGNITIAGQAGSGNAVNRGVEILGGNVKVSSNGGNISISGTGNATSTANFNIGVSIRDTAEISAINDGDINITGIGGSGTTSNFGLEITSPGTLISVVDGAISINGTGGNGPGDANEGARIFEAIVQATGTGSIAFSGQGANANNTNFGLRFNDATIQSSGGGISLMGQGAGTGNNNSGIIIENNTLFQDSNTGAIEVSGTSQNTSTPAIGIIDFISKIMSGGPITVTAVTGPFISAAGIPPTSLLEGSTVTFNGKFSAGFNLVGQLPISGNTFLSAGDEFIVTINGPTAGTNYDQLTVLGTVDITDATLNIVDNVTTPMPPATVLTLIDNDDVDFVTGTFNGLPNGSQIILNGQSFVIIYNGGDGNDVVLLQDTPPTAMCQDITVQLDGTGSVTILPADIDNGSSDPDGPVTLSVDIDTFTCADIGPNTVTLTVTDSVGNTATCTAIVTVEDSIAPTAICQNFTVELDANGEGTLTGADIDGGSSDNCGNVTFTVSQNMFTCADITAPATIVSPLLITGIYDGPLAGGTPKGVELKVQENIADLSLYGLGSANNGGGTDGEEFTFPAVSANAGEYIYVSSEDVEFTNFFGFAPDYTDGAMGINGDDAVELFFNGAVIDTFGDINTDGTGEAWDYLDGWAYRMNEQTTNGGTFVASNWTYSGINVFDGETTNATAANPFPIGTYFVTPSTGTSINVTLTVTDDSGNMATCTAQVSVIDTIAPIITCPANQTENADASCEFIIPDYAPLAVINDNCSVVSITQNPAPGTIVSIGTTSVEIIVSDGTNITSCSFDIEVENNEAPTISCPANITEVANASCEFILPDYTSLATVENDCDGSTTVTQLPVAGTIVTAGTTTITLTLEDGANTTDCTFDVMIVDDIDPVAICQNITVELDINGEASITAADIDGGSTDNCGNVTLTVSQTDFTCADLDPTPAPLLPLLITGVYDGPLAGGTPKGIELKVQENIADLSLYGLGSANNGGGTDGEEFTFPAVSATAGDFIYVSSEAIGFTDFFGFPPTYTDSALDVNGNDAIELFFNGAVIDTFGDINTDGTGQPWEYLDGWVYRVNDQPTNAGIFNDANWIFSGINALDGETTNATAANPFPTAAFTTTPPPPGVVLVTLTVTDDAGNTSTCTGQVTVEDNLTPSLTCPADQTEGVNTNCEFIIPDYTVLATATDNCNSITLTQTPAAGTIVTIGITTITIIADDGTNSDSCTFDITVVDDVAPTAVCQDITVMLDATGMATITATDVDGGSADNCGNVTTSIDIDMFDCTNVGPNDVTLTVTDDIGNISMCTAVVTVVDDIAPDAVCQDITILLDTNGMASITPQDVDGGSFDNCGIDTVTIDIDTFDCSNVGVNMVTLTVTDVNGNTSTCIANVTVEQQIIAPNAICQNVTVPLDQNGMATISPSAIDAGSTGAGCVDGLTLDIDTFDCSNIGTPVMVMLTVTNANGVTDSCTAFVNVIDNLAPQVMCPADQTVISTGPYILPDYFVTGEATATDNCTNPITVTDQDPNPGTALPQGMYTITLTAEDNNGFEDECTFILTVNDLLGNENPEIALTTVVLYPNPATNFVILSNPQNVMLTNMTIYDITGRSVQQVRLNEMGESKTIDVSALQSANYLVLIESEFGQISKRLLIE